MTPDIIEAEYRRRVARHPSARWGWSFMYTPAEALDRAKAVLVGLNPGGSELDAPGEWDYTGGKNAYVDESWGGRPAGEYPLQQQVKLLFEAAKLKPDEVFAANFVPFRSRSWIDLPDREDALQFSRTLWLDLLRRTPARLFMSLGKQAGAEIAHLLSAQLTQTHPVEWGNQTMDEYVAADGRIVVALPHLSRYRIFGGNRTAATATLSDISDRIIRE